MIVTVGKNGALPLPDNELFPEECKLKIGDVLFCKVTGDKRTLTLEKFEDQTLTDEEIEAHGSLTRVKLLEARDF